MQIAAPQQSLQWKLAAAFIAVAFFVAAFVVVVIAFHVDALERAARLEGAHVAELIADVAIQNGTLRPDLQAFVDDLVAPRHRDIVIVDARGMGLADADADEVGQLYRGDSGNEVTKTIGDGEVRSFIEENSRHRNGAYQVVVPLRRSTSNVSGPPLGAVIVEYTAIREQLFAVERRNLYLLSGVGAGVVLLVTIFGLQIAARIAQPLHALKNSVERIADEDYEARVTVGPNDELGLLGAAFNKMAENLSASHTELLDTKRQLEQRVAQRTRDLSEVNVSLREEVRQHKLAVERADYLAYYDVLTGLANRGLFLDRTAQHMRSATIDGHELAVFLVDIERFKNINDTLGQAAGDDLLKQVAKWLTDNVGDASLVARLGADHFAVVVPEVRKGGDMTRLLERLMTGFLEHTFRLSEVELRVATRVGAALFPNDATDPDTLLKHAEAALKKAKASGERYLFYEQKMSDTVAGELTLENQLRQAVDREEFVLHYQPKINLETGKVVGAEALIRWNDPRTGTVPPERFISVLEETGLIFEVGRWALRRAVEDYISWRSAGLEAVRIAVNVSPLQLRHRAFVDEVRQAIDIDSRAPAGLELEITEGAVMEHVKHNVDSLDAFRAMGIRLAIDRFGTGFSSLSYLSRLPVDTLKIDRAFVVDMTSGPQGLSLISTIINLARSLRLRIVAVGVETEEQSRLLRLLSCDEMQGYLFSRAVPREVFAANYLPSVLAVEQSA